MIRNVLFTLSLSGVLFMSCGSHEERCHTDFEHAFFHFIQGIDTLETENLSELCMSDENYQHLVSQIKEKSTSAEESEMKELEERTKLKWQTDKEHLEEMYNYAKEQGHKFDVRWNDMELLSFGRMTSDYYGVEREKGEVMFRNENYSFVLPFEAYFIDDAWRISDLGKLQKRKL